MMMKSNMKYLSLFLAVMICFSLVIIISTENQMKKPLTKENENRFCETVFEEKKTSSNIKLEEKNIPCTDFGNYFNVLLKCCFAFMLGGLISERKFIVLGRI